MAFSQQNGHPPSPVTIVGSDFTLTLRLHPTSVTVKIMKNHSLIQCMMAALTSPKLFCHRRGCASIHRVSADARRRHHNQRHARQRVLLRALLSILIASCFRSFACIKPVQALEDFLTLNEGECTCISIEHRSTYLPVITPSTLSCARDGRSQRV